MRVLSTKGAFMNDVTAHFSKLMNLQMHNQLDLEVQRFRRELLASGGKYADLRNLNRFEHEMLSQCGEDGIVDEIFRRIGTTNRFFVEFGAGNGVQNSTASLFFDNWSGAWIEGDHGNAETIRKKFAPLLLRHRLRFTEAFITAENIEELLKSLDIPEEFDLLSVDIDGNDYWVWQTITKFRPRVVICEYNARYGGHTPWVMKYNPSHIWNGSCYYGASLKALEKLGASKGYVLVGCNLAGVNAFFVRREIAADLFQGPYSAEFHYEPQRFFLVQSSLQGNDFGAFELV